MKENVLAMTVNHDYKGKWGMDFASAVMSIISYTLKFRFGSDEKGWINRYCLAEVDSDATAFAAMKMVAEFLGLKLNEIGECVEIKTYKEAY